MPGLEYLKRISVPVIDYKLQIQYKSVFRGISGYYYHENFHSDILAYYLEYDIVKKNFIEWMNKRSDENDIINYNEYQEGKVHRESDRIDITIFNSKNDAAIIIENKSNNASDQNKQLYRYCNALKEKEIKVERIFYLNKNSYVRPVLSGIPKEAEREINRKLIIGQLVGNQSFTSEVINQVLACSNDIRLNALSQEIRDLFNSVVYGDINMENLSLFIDELKKDDNLAMLKKSIQAYEDIPEYLAKYYQNYVISKETGHKIFIHRSVCLVIDGIIRNDRIFAIDIWFCNDQVDFSILVRSGEQDDVDKLREQLGDEFPFKEYTNDRYRFIYKEPLNETEIKKLIDDLLTTFGMS